jgi:large subunit ribosomal protein L6
MSRIGNKPIALPSGVSVQLASDSIEVKGGKGKLSRQLLNGITVREEDNTLYVARANDSRQQRAFHGLSRALIANMVHGVSTGFERKLEIQGVGYKADVVGNKLVLNLGYSHPIDYLIPQGISIAVDRGVRLSVAGIDKEQVGQVAAEIRGYRPPDSYKGKGVRYEGEHVRLKAGKSAL